MAVQFGAFRGSFYQDSCIETGCREKELERVSSFGTEPPK